MPIGNVCNNVMYVCNVCSLPSCGVLPRMSRLLKKAYVCMCGVQDREIMST